LHDDEGIVTVAGGVHSPVPRRLYKAFQPESKRTQRDMEIPAIQIERYRRLRESI
jgi:hypothetical protein